MHEKAASLQLEAKTKILDSITENLELIEPHQAFFILKNPFHPFHPFHPEKRLLIPTLTFSGKYRLFQGHWPNAGI